MKKSLLLAMAAMLLGGCPGPTPVNNDAAPRPTPTPSPTPAPWLAVEPACAGKITRAEWLVCDDKTLNALHRRLALEWEAARQSATQEQIQVQRNQLNALLSERTACQNAACIATAYRRYVTAPPPAPVVVKPRPKPKPRPRPRRSAGSEAVGIQSCQNEIGRADALELARQCSAAGGGQQCSIRRSCAGMEERIERACLTWRQPPAYCPQR